MADLAVTNGEVDFFFIEIGQLLGALNIFALWDLPATSVCKNDHCEWCGVFYLCVIRTLE